MNGDLVGHTETWMGNWAYRANTWRVFVTSMTRSHARVVHSDFPTQQPQQLPGNQAHLHLVNRSLPPLLLPPQLPPQHFVNSHCARHSDWRQPLLLLPPRHFANSLYVRRNDWRSLWRRQSKCWETEHFRTKLRSYYGLMMYFLDEDAEVYGYVQMNAHGNSNATSWQSAIGRKGLEKNWRMY